MNAAAVTIVVGVLIFMLLTYLQEKIKKNIEHEKISKGLHGTDNDFTIEDNLEAT